MGEIDEAIELITSDASGYVTSNEWDGRIDRGILDKNLLDGKVSDGEREVMHSLLDLITAFANPDGNAELAPLVGVEERKKWLCATRDMSSTEMLLPFLEKGVSADELRTMNVYDMTSLFMAEYTDKAQLKLLRVTQKPGMVTK